MYVVPLHYMYMNMCIYVHAYKMLIDMHCMILQARI